MMEVTSPAGDPQKLRYALNFGADAVYAGLQSFSLRARAENFTLADLAPAASWCHQRGKKIYVTLNIFPHKNDWDNLPDAVARIGDSGVDAVIVSDPGVFALVRRVAPDLRIHISTQANITSAATAKFWYEQGASRVILARELSLEEIAHICATVPEVETEVFAHGAMCMSYSGRCLLSAFLNNRSANRGLCTQTCRWEYSLIENSRPDRLFPLEEDDRGSYILNSYDLMLYDRLADLYNAGVTSIKIEGRMKSLYYAANTARVYAQGINAVKQGIQASLELREELFKVSRRPYSQGFIDGHEPGQNVKSSKYIQDYSFLGTVESCAGNLATIHARARFAPGEQIEVITPDISQDFSFTVTKLYNADGEDLDFTRPDFMAQVELPKPVNGPAILRKKVG